MLVPHSNADPHFIFVRVPVSSLSLDIPEWLIEDRTTVVGSSKVDIAGSMWGHLELPKILRALHSCRWPSINSIKSQCAVPVLCYGSMHARRLSMRKVGIEDASADHKAPILRAPQPCSAATRVPRLSARAHHSPGHPNVLYQTIVQISKWRQKLVHLTLIFNKTIGSRSMEIQDVRP